MVPQKSVDAVHCLVFHDLSVNPVPTLRALLIAAQSNVPLSALLQACEKGIRAESATLNPSDRSRIPSFRSLQELLRCTEDSSAPTNVIVSAILTVTAQLGCFALLVERSPSWIAYDGRDLEFLGLCKGIIVAATAAAVTSLSDLIQLSESIVKVAFRFGLEADRRARTLERDLGSWALALPEISVRDVESLLGDFNTKNRLPKHLAAYVSAQLPSCVTVSGTPSTLASLVDTVLRPERIIHKSLNITAPFHAIHLACPDVNFIVDIPELEASCLRPRSSVIPSQPNVRIYDTNLKSALRILITGVFQKRMVMAAVDGSCASKFQGPLKRVTSLQPCSSPDTVRKILGLGEETEYSTADIVPSNDIPLSRAKDDIVAIIGMAGRFPSADTLDEYWSIISSGSDVHQPISSRIDPRSQSGASRATASAPSGCFMKNPAHFDNAFFNLSPREAKQIDPQHRILLMVTQEALQTIGYSNAGTKRIGTFFGQATDDWRESHIRQNIDIFYIGAGMRAFAPGRLNYHYKWEGPSYNVDAACSASLAALELATKAIQSGDCDLAVVGGGNLCSALPMFEGLAKGRFTSKTGSCKTFCASADGYCRGEAVGVVILQRTEDTIRENTPIHGFIGGIATNHSAWASSITHPHAGAQERLMMHTLDLARAISSDVDYVEFHGTGTQAGDKAEMESVSRVFDMKGTRSAPLYVGAVKSNIGHCEAAAGIVSLIKALLMFRHNTIPPHCGIKSHINPGVAEVMSADLSIPDQAIQFERKERPRSILINNFNATGGNTCVLVREPPPPRKPIGTDPRSHFPIVVSGHSPHSLRANFISLNDYSNANPVESIANISYSTTARRTHHQYRKGFVGDAPKTLPTAIDQALDRPAYTPSSVPAVAFVFAGQGTQKQGIAAELFQTSPFFSSTLLKFESACKSLGLPPFVELLTDKDSHVEWSAVQLQVATVAIEVALARLWQSWNIQPSFVIGHSLGEYAALCVSGVLSEMDMFSLVGKRAQLMEELCQADTHSMLSVLSAADEIQSLLQQDKFDDCQISCYNSPQAITVGGPRESLESLKEELAERKVKSTLLSTKYAFHSPNIEPILEKFAEFAATIPFRTPETLILSTLLGEPVTEKGVFDAQYLVDQARKPVRFGDALQVNAERAIWIEFGPGDPACLSFVKSTVEAELKAQILPSLSTRNPTWQTISENVVKCYEHGLEVDWSAYHRDHEKSLRLLELPTYAFDLQEFWIPVGTPQESQPEVDVPPVKLDPFLHTLEKCSIDKQTSSLDLQSKLNDELVYNTISGHFVMDAPLCPSSVYCVMALRAVSILLSKMNQHSKEPGCNAWKLQAMDIHQPLVLRKSESRSLKVSASRQAGEEVISIAFSSHDGDSESQDHARCSLLPASVDSWKLGWSKLEFLVWSRVLQLEAADSDSTLRLTKPVIYKLFSHIVAYSKHYHGIQNIALQTAAHEAVAEVQFDKLAGVADDYDVHLMDSLMHFAGFILNNGIDNDDFAYVSDGWDCLQVPPGLDPASRYKFYVRLSADEREKSYSGDLYVFRDSKIVASCSGVRFSKIKKDSLRRALNRGVKQTNSPRQTSPHPAQQTPQYQLDGPSRHASSPDRSPDPDVEQKLRDIVSQEAGVPAERVVNTTSLSELGLDSILMSTVLDKIQEHFGVEVPSSQAHGAQNFQELKALVFTETLTNISSQPENDSSPSSLSSNDSATSHSTWPTIDSEHNEPSCVNPEPSSLFALVLSIISQHTGVPEDTVCSIDDFAKLGVDSMLSFDILDQIQEASEIELPSSFLQQNPNIDAITRALAVRGHSESTSQSRSAIATETRHTPTANGTSAPVRYQPTPTSSCTISPQIKPLPRAHTPSNSNELVSKSLGSSKAPAVYTAPDAGTACCLRLLHGNPSSEYPPIFLFPPGEGTCSGYNNFPPHPSDAPIYCPKQNPYFDNPDSLENTFANLALAYKALIQAKQAHGPYVLAGYSVGGALAFEIARLLLLEGEAIKRLVIMDTPAPEKPVENGRWFGLEAFRMIGFQEHSYLSDDAGLKRTAASARAYNGYEPRAFGAKKPEKMMVLWATKGRTEELPARCLAEQKLLEQCPESERAGLINTRNQETDKTWYEVAHTDFGLRGWEKWLGTSAVDIQVVEGTHLSIVYDPDQAAAVGKKLYAALA